MKNVLFALLVGTLILQNSCVNTVTARGGDATAVCGPGDTSMATGRTVTKSGPGSTATAQGGKASCTDR